MRLVLTAVFAASLLSLGFSAPSQAQTAEQRAACKDDFQKLCKGVMPGGGRVMKCLSEHKDKVSEACRKAANI
ncbi:MAG TPA: cysteine rich repeat-containing protein [Xanthobacteraceae bacterium]|jgi:hypothetical protein|nr:cysteine rich repeat-containing protein [Xanthobacteraceae bacterium]